jgi:hypothetical protein
MSKVYCLSVLLILVSVNTYAVEPVLDQQGMFYFNMTFDAGHSTKTDHDFGFRLDRTLAQPGENITMSQLADKPAVFNLKLNSNGLKAFELNGIDYSYVDYVARGAEGGEVESQPEPEVTEQPKRKVDIPLGVIIGVLIGLAAIGS